MMLMLGEHLILAIEQIHNPGPGYAVPLNLASPVQKTVLAGGPNPDSCNGIFESSSSFGYKWTRAVVLKMQEKPVNTLPIGSNVSKLRVGALASVHKNGKIVVKGSGSANYDGFDTGTSWFPGYEIIIETGERFDIIFGEDSSMVNGDDPV